MPDVPAALVVHDLKNELGALEAALQTLALDPQPSLAHGAHRQCQRLRQRLVAYLALYGGDDTLRARCDDESPCDLLAALAARHPQATPQVLFMRPADPPPYWYFDRRLVAMALDAALHNALRFACSRVELRLRVEHGHLVLTVDDDGPGLAGAESALAPCSHASGLGTALCRAVALAHGSLLGADSVRLLDGPLGGARFELWLAT